MEYDTGDTVVCIEPCGDLELNETYVVANTDGELTWVYVDGIAQGGFYPWRFILAPTESSFFD